MADFVCLVNAICKLARDYSFISPPSWSLQLIFISKNFWYLGAKFFHENQLEDKRPKNLRMPL